MDSLPLLFGIIILYQLWLFPYVAGNLGEDGE